VYYKDLSKSVNKLPAMLIFKEVRKYNVSSEIIFSSKFLVTKTFKNKKNSATDD